ncbi:MAG: hypothetical protein KF745_14245 [Phycisphaeraceae bacterium]|nr:hypothetical protein [Phycisphaeraceae bacterium]
MPKHESKSPEEMFWNWFQRNSAAMLQANDPDSPPISEMQEQLWKVGDGLSWELSQSGVTPRQIIISADGDIDNVDAVERLCDAAPAIPQWQVIRFRPRIPDSVLESEGAGLAFEDLEFDLAEIEAAISPGEDGKIDIELFLKGCKEVNDERFINPGFILLDMALGEYDTMCKVQFLQVSPLRNRSAAGTPRFPFVELRARFDHLFEKLNAG